MPRSHTKEASIPTTGKTSSNNVEHDVRTYDSLPDDDHNNNSEPRRQLPGDKVFMTGPWVPEEIVARNAKVNPKLEFHIFTNEAMEESVRLIDAELVRLENITGALDAWKMLRPWAFRADLWRYMILWHEGGIYLDSKLRTLVPLRTFASLADDESLACCHDENNWTWPSLLLGEDVPVYWNAFLSARKGCPVMLEAIRMSLKNIELRSKYLFGEETAILNTDHADLSLTGPVLLGYAATRVALRGTHGIPTHVRIPCGVFVQEDKEDESEKGKSGGEEKRHQPPGIRERRIREPGIFEVGGSEEDREVGAGRLLELDVIEHQQVKGPRNDYHDMWRFNMTYCDSTRRVKHNVGACAGVAKLHTTDGDTVDK